MRRFRTAHRKTSGDLHAREAGDVNIEVREAVDQNGYSLFRIGLSLSEIPKP
jgi:hypothetical protein